MTPEEMADLAHLRRARDLMDRDFAEPLDVLAMAQAALMSPAHFSRRFRAAYGETPYAYLMTRRIERAKAFLRQGLSVADTCLAVGCTSLGSFSSRFTEIVGETPSQYRSRDHRGLEVVPPCGSMVGTRPRRTPGASGGFRWVMVGSPGRDLDIVLFQPHGGRSQTEGDALLSLVTKGSLQAAIFRSCKDLDATFETLRASGAEVLQEPATQPWGARDCALRDPSGNLVRIAQA